eukprot:CAMPEP_0171458024 /NCGR_PEP_ID=MMETSP0945-20130129/3861_1 /TAXON_ID=109269 /ORGANISM="Vaucheria litorea, Strain CCMP2940" /LENGTH=308 /DNA_ID=CAMNT_0011983735 /DNA_START=115 /DNA_END=1041 /DNA_ORIENTATION=+
MTTDDSTTANFNDRRNWIENSIKTASGIVTLTNVVPVNAAYSDNSVEGLPTSGFYIQHAVLNVNNLESNIKFWCDGLGMEIIRERTINGSRTVFLSYGKETLQEKNQGYFSLELSQKKKTEYGMGNSFKFLTLTLPEKPIKLGLRVTENFGQIVPHWFLEKNFVEFSSPDGVSVRVKQGNKRDPITSLTFGSKNLQKTKEYYANVLKMKQLNKNPFEKRLDMGYEGGNIQLSFLKETSDITPGVIFNKLAVVTNNAYEMGDLVKQSDFGKVLFVGEVPNIGTKVANTIDKDFHGTVFVDYDDFEKELV